MGNNIYDEVSILIVGFDGYRDVWEHSIELMNKYWQNRPKTYLATSELSPNYKNVEIIKAGPNSEWSKKAKTALDKIKTPYVILLLEDFFISDYVDHKKLKSVLKMVKNDNIKFYQILVQLIRQSWEKGKPYKGNKHIHIIPRNKRYGINLQAAIWEKEFLEKTIGEGNYNAWSFEVMQLGTENYNVGKIEFLIDDRNLLNIIHTVVQSKYLPKALRLLKRKGHNINPAEREVLGGIENLKYQLKLLMYSFTPGFLVKPAKAIGRILKIDFVTDRIRN